MNTAILYLRQPTYIAGVFWIDADTIMQGASLVDERRILVVIVLNIHCERSGTWHTFFGIARTILQTKRKGIKTLFDDNAKDDSALASF